MALSRLTSENARFIADSNPESPNHWLYTEKIKPFLEGNKDVAEVFDYFHFNFGSLKKVHDYVNQPYSDFYLQIKAKYN